MTTESNEANEGRPRISLRAVADVGIVVVLSAIGIVGFTAAFDDIGWLIAGIAGLAVGVAAAISSHFLRLGAIPTFLLAVVAYFVFGSAAVVPELSVLGFIPTLESVINLSIGTVYAWADVLTLRPPVELPDYVTAAPYVASWAVGLVSTVLAVRWLPSRRRTASRSVLLLLGPLVLYLAGVLLGTDEPVFAAVRGISFASLVLIWLGWRRGTGSGVTAAADRGMLRKKVTGSALVIGAAVLVGVFVGAAIAPVPSDRFVLREVVTPPFEPLAYASPFTAYRKYTKTLEQTELFTVEGMRPGDRLRLATLDTYDGISWGVAGSQLAVEGSGSFSLVGSSIPAPPLLTASAEQSRFTVTIDEYADVWLPSIGYATSIAFDGADAHAQAGSLRYNPATGTAVLTSGLSAGDEYFVIAEQQRVFQPEELAGVAIASFSLPPVSVIPDIVTAKAEEFAGNASTPIEKLRAIESTLQTTGFLSHGAADDSVASRAGQGADRMVELFSRSQLIGDEEQYASAFALMARSFDYPARVVMGFAPEVRDGQDSVVVMGKDVTAWVEVAFDGVGWVPFYPTPDETDIPQDQNPKPQSEPQPQVRQPPRTDADENDLVAGVEVDDSSEDDDAAFQIPGWLIAVGLAVLIPAALCFLPLLLVRVIKARRVRRRRGAASGDLVVAGAWDELVDRFGEFGFVMPEKLTRIGVARGLETQLPPASVELQAIAVRADEAVFSGADISQDMALTVWTEVLSTTTLAERSLSRGRRFVSKYRINSLREWASALVARASADAAHTSGKTK